MGTTITELPSYFHQSDNYSRSRDYALLLDQVDPLRAFRDEFIIPSKKDLKRTEVMSIEDSDPSDPPSIYLCGNSLGLQPNCVKKYIDTFLRSWAIKGVRGHFDALQDTPFPRYLDADTAGSELLAPLVGAFPHEVALMGTLTGNLHLLLASFYLPTEERFKIIMEGRAFPSDHYAVESQILHRGFPTKEAMVLIEPEDPDVPLLRTEQILKVIDEHASQTALVLLPGVQYYTGQYFDIPKITQHAHSKGLLIGWDCAHAVGNVELELHEWDVDFAVWCHYKYVNSGPGAMAGLFVHERHCHVNHEDSGDGRSFRPRLTGWWGHDKGTRFIMDNEFVPQAGAAGYQVSNPSILDMSAVAASLEIFNRATINRLRKKSVSLTSYLEYLLLNYLQKVPQDKPFRIITSSNPSERGAQLSLLLKPGLLDKVLEHLEAEGVVVDERKPNVLRVAPAPLYNSFVDVWEFYQIFSEACSQASQ